METPPVNVPLIADIASAIEGYAEASSVAGGRLLPFAGGLWGLLTESARTGAMPSEPDASAVAQALATGLDGKVALASIPRLAQGIRALAVVVTSEQNRHDLNLVKFNTELFLGALDAATQQPRNPVAHRLIVRALVRLLDAVPDNAGAS